MGENRTHHTVSTVSRGTGALIVQTMLTVVTQNSRLPRRRALSRRLDVTEGTVKVHLHNIYVKFAIRNRTMMSLLALNLDVTAPTIESGVSLAA